MKAFITKLSLMIIVCIGAMLASCDNDNTNITNREGELFSVCTLNVDGLIAGNLEGPNALYTPVIGEWLTNGSFSFMGVQEDFEFDPELSAPLAEGFNRDTWGGGMQNEAKFIYETGEDNTPIVRFNTDGLNAFWKKDLIVERTDSVRWTDNCGYFAHAWDENVVKGFRRYDVTTPEGNQLVIYNMHMDAGDEEEELQGLDEADREARISQWKQLRDYIMAHLDQRPVIILGDLNTYYVRDDVKAQIIDVINQSGYATITDAWIQQKRKGEYTPMGDTRIQPDSPTSGWTVNGEAPDKILYINPIGATCKLELVSVTFHNQTYFREDGTTPLGDHYPLSAQFRIKHSHNHIIY
ncbi:MAG: hypothetical protein J6Y39_06985 [Bacteroidaceae bacterium]|nr:hypothetical protein [Bacteroidaceae bacterium]